MTSTDRLALPDSPDPIAAALAYSRYAQRLCHARPALRDWLERTLDAPFDWRDESAALEGVVARGDSAELAVALRQLRQRVMLHTLVRDLTGRAPLAEVMASVTVLAERAIAAAVTVSHRRLAAQYGEPRDFAGGAGQLCVLALGKLGGAELNVSSDIDIVFAYPDDGDTDGERSIANREFFDRVGRSVVALLHDITDEGFVFRVDLRLRPYGDSGPLTLPFAALEQYLITQGRTWERYAWLKARALTGGHAQALADLIDPFVYRKYLDYDAYDGLRDVHRQIREQAQRRSHGDDIKLGRGGIREIEFTVQALQLVRGGRDAALRERGTLPALGALGRRGQLPSQAITALGEAYAYLRVLEHRLQYRDDRQTQRLPEDEGERAALAHALGHADVAAMTTTLAGHRTEVDLWFNSAFGPQELAPAEPGDAFAGVWDDPAPDAHRELLAGAGYADPDTLLRSLAATRAASRYQALPAQSRSRVDRLVPRLLAAAAAAPGPSGAQATFMRLLALLESVAKRSAYLALLLEHPPLVPRLAHLTGVSAWAADYLTQHPLLMDELLDAQVLLAAPDWEAWRTELAQQLAAHPGDAEREMDVLRHFQQAQTFRLLAQDLAGVLTVERLADHLSMLADIIIAATVTACWRHVQPDADAPPRFAVLAYGKLGGKELGYASDLDLVFLYDVLPTDSDPEGAPQRYVRLAQRINNWLTQVTAAGGLYATDLRLRPDGASGTFCSSLAAFRKYQQHSAWTWEHQALTRARVVAGDDGIRATFEQERDAILRAPRDATVLARDVVDMRQRMLAGHPNRGDQFDVKHDPGGMVDIEFIVQYLVLRHAATHAAMTVNAGNIALLHQAAALSLVEPLLATPVADAYRVYRRVQHAVRLTGATHVRVDPAQYAPQRQDVTALWASVFGQPWASQPVR